MITIHVTQKHIDQGIRKNCNKCPVALALREATGQLWNVTGWDFVLRTLVEAPPLKFSIPRFVQDQISGFDRGESIQPFSFQFGK